ncbi:hypothetical protein TNCV_2300861 [Trichonephila clavipes]|nr:hypothetical protein TNCV_2300861 [Trichonephila clavipes]
MLTRVRKSDKLYSFRWQQQLSAQGRKFVFSVVSVEFVSSSPVSPKSRYAEEIIHDKYIRGSKSSRLCDVKIWRGKYQRMPLRLHTHLVHNPKDDDAGCHWEMEREAFLHPISRLLMWPDVGGPA